MNKLEAWQVIKDKIWKLSRIAADSGDDAFEPMDEEYAKAYRIINSIINETDNNTWQCTVGDDVMESCTEDNPHIGCTMRHKRRTG